VRREKLEPEAGDSSGTQGERKRPSLVAARKQRLVKTVKCCSIVVVICSYVV
jgi:hypothetical protein